MTASLIVTKKKSPRRCCVCNARLKIHEGNLCSCSMMLCMKHRYKGDHSCPDDRLPRPMEKVEARKVEQI